MTCAVYGGRKAGILKPISDDNEKTGIYVVDKDYRVLYFNDAAKAVYPNLKTGMHCYQGVCGENHPCSSCPGLDRNINHEMFYNETRKQWLELSIGDMEWPGCGPCHMVLFRPLDEQKKRELAGVGYGGRIEERDPLTGLYRYGPFYERAEQILRENPDREFCMVAIDIEHFKLFNDWYGEEAGDYFLINIGRHLKAVEEKGRSAAGYMGGDDFVILVQKDPVLLETLQKEIENYVKQYGGNAGFLPAFGIYEIENTELSVSMMYDRAVIALASVKGNYAKRTGWYDAGMKKKLEDDQVLLSEVQRALERREFVFYAQPQCNMMTGKIIGMESLVRWNHPERGVVYPGEFLPLLERNGLITNLDLYLWELVCIWLHGWLEKGHRPVPVSVNVSRIDIYSINVTRVLEELVSRYEIPVKLLEVEITESAYAEDYDLIRRVVNDLRKSGFTVFMDDFGSGYSSLNMLKDVNVDVIKIDTKFLEMDAKSMKRGAGILETIVRLARLMKMRVIAEGVEKKEHVDLLGEMGCLYGQGYYYYRPMPIEKMEELLLDEKNVDYRGIEARQLEEIRLEDLFDQDITSEMMLNNMLGGIALYEVYGDTYELLRVNEGYYRVTGCNPVDLEERRLMIGEQIHRDDRQKVLDLFRQAYENPIGGAEGTVRRYRLNGELMWLHIKVFFLREQDDHRLYYGSVSDATEQKQQEEKLASSRKILEDVLKLEGTDGTIEKLVQGNQWMAGGIFAQMAPGGLIGGYCEEGFPLYFANNEMVRLLGYDSYEEFVEGIGGKVANTIHPEDMAQVRQDIGLAREAGQEYTTRYRMPRKDGSWFWVLDKGRVVQAEDGRLAIVSACMDITDSVTARQKLEEVNQALQFKNRELEFLSSGVPSGYHRSAVMEDLDFLFISDRFLAILGYTAEEMKRRFHNKFKELFHPDDWLRARRAIDGADKNGSLYTIECRLRAKKGYIWVLYQLKRAQRGDGEFLYGVILDIDEVVALRQEVGESRKRLSELERRKQSETDLLTGVYNKKAAIPVIREWVLRRRGQKSALVLFHLEGFRAVNDAFGKISGDQILAEYVDRLKRLFREEDVVCRVSGMEILILCKNIGENDIRRKLERVAADMRIVIDPERCRIKLCASAGYVMIPDESASFDALYGETREALAAARTRCKGSCLRYGEGSV